MHPSPASTTPTPARTTIAPGVGLLFARAAYIAAVSTVTMVPALLGGLLRGVLSGRAAGHRHVYQRLVVLLERLGPAFVKAGQVLGTRRDVLPPDLCTALAVLRDTVPPMSGADTTAALAAAFGDELDELFDDVDRTAVASGSVACVHRARLRSGREVALKLRRPGIDAVMNLDLTLMRRGAALAARLPVLVGVPLTAIVDQLADAVLNQLDFEREAEALRQLRQNLSVVPRLWVPQVHLELCRSSCIVMEFIPGLAVDTADGCSAAVRKRFGASSLNAIYQMLFIDGFVHCDMHPGNMYFTRSAQVVVLDAGFSVQLDDRIRRLFAEFFMNMAIGRGRRAAEIVVESAAGLRPDADVAGFVGRMAELVERSHGQSAREFSLVAFATEMFLLQRKHGVHAAPEIIFPLLALLVIEGTIRDLDPEVDFQKAARPILQRGLFGRSG